MSGTRRAGDIAAALTSEASRHEQAADRYQALGDHNNARVSRQLAVALRAATDAYQRRTAQRAALVETSSLVGTLVVPPVQLRGAMASGGVAGGSQHHDSPAAAELVAVSSGRDSGVGMAAAR